MTIVAVYAIDGTAMAITAASSASSRPITRLASSHAGTAARDIAIAFVALAAAYAFGSASNSQYAGAISAG